MDINAQPRVVGQIPARVVGVIVDYDLIRVPLPAVHIRQVVGSNAEIVVVEPKAVGPTAPQTPNMLRTEAATEVAVFPRMVKVVVGIIWARMSYPLSIAVNVGRIRVTSLIVEVAVLLGLPVLGVLVVSPLTLRSMRRDISTAYMTAAMLIALTPAAMLIVTMVLRQCDRGH